MSAYESKGVRDKFLIITHNYFMTISPTSVEAERAFSADDYICSPLRSKLSDDTLSRVCLLTFLAIIFSHFLQSFSYISCNHFLTFLAIIFSHFLQSFSHISCNHFLTFLAIIFSHFLQSFSYISCNHFLTFLAIIFSHLIFKIILRLCSLYF